MPISAAKPLSRTELEAEARKIVKRLGGCWNGRSGQCRCPAHDDANPSLSLRFGDRSILYHCFAGCSVLDVMSAIWALGDGPGARTQEPQRRRKADRYSGLALQLWCRAVPVSGSLAETYLRS